MNDVSSLNHSRWECKYHVVWIPKYRKKTLYGQLRKYLIQVFKDLARARECEVLEGHLMVDHVHIHLNTSQICGIPSNWVPQREKRYSYSS